MVAANSLTFSEHPWPDIPAELTEWFRRSLDEVADDMIAAIQAKVREYDRPGHEPYSTTLRFAVERFLQYIVDQIDSPQYEPNSVVDFFRAIGRREAAEGRSLDALYTAMRVGSLVAWRRISEGLNERPVPAQTLAAFAEAVMLFQDELARAAAEGYSQAREAVAGEMQRRRKRLIDLLLSEPPATQEAVADLAAAAHWPIPRTVAAVALGKHCQDSRQPVFPPDVLADLGRRVPTLIIPDPDGPGRAKLIDRALTDCVAIVGPTVPLVEVGRSMRWARKTLALTQRGIIDANGVVRSVEHMSTLILFQDEALLSALGELRLEPLAHLRPSQQDRLAETLLAWLQSGRNANEVAMRLHVHPQTVRYRLRQLEELFGDRLLDPDQRFDLEIVLRARRLLSEHEGRLLPIVKEAVGSAEVVALRRRP